MILISLNHKTGSKLKKSSIFMKIALIKSINFCPIVFCSKVAHAIHMYLAGFSTYEIPNFTALFFAIQALLLAWHSDHIIAHCTILSYIVQSFDFGMQTYAIILGFFLHICTFLSVFKAVYTLEKEVVGRPFWKSCIQKFQNKPFCFSFQCNVNNI